MVRKEKNIEEILVSTPVPLPPDGLLQKLEANILLPTRQPQSAFQSLLMWMMPKHSLRRMAAITGVVLIILIPVAYSTGIIPKGIFNFGFVKGAKITYRGFSTSKTLASSDPDYKAKFEQFKKMFNEGKVREKAHDEYVAILAGGEEFSFKGNPNSVLYYTKTEEDIWQKQINEALTLKKYGIYEKIYYPRWTMETIGGIAGPSGRYIMERYVLSDGRLFTPGCGESALENAQAFSEIESLRKEGKFIKIYRPIDTFLKNHGEVKYEVPFGPHGENYRYCESTYLVSDGRLFIIGEYESASISETAFKEIEKLRVAGLCHKKVNPQRDLKLKDGWYNYVEKEYVLSNGTEINMVEYEKRK